MIQLEVQLLFLAYVSLSSLVGHITSVHLLNPLSVPVIDRCSAGSLLSFRLLSRTPDLICFLHHIHKSDSHQSLCSLHLSGFHSYRNHTDGLLLPQFLFLSWMSLTDPVRYKYTMLSLFRHLL